MLSQLFNWFDWNLKCFHSWRRKIKGMIHKLCNAKYLTQSHLPVCMHFFYIYVYILMYNLSCFFGLLAFLKHFVICEGPFTVYNHFHFRFFVTRFQCVCCQSICVIRLLKSKANIVEGGTSIVKVDCSVEQDRQNLFIQICSKNLWWSRFACLRLIIKVCYQPYLHRLFIGKILNLLKSLNDWCLNMNSLIKHFLYLLLLSVSVFCPI